MPSGSINRRFVDRLAIRVPAGMSDAVNTAAARRQMNPAEWARQVLIRELSREGLELAPLGLGAAAPRCRPRRRTP
jgi:hypothetical protein